MTNRIDTVQDSAPATELAAEPDSQASDRERLVAYYLARCGVRDPDTGRMHPPPGLGARTWREALESFYPSLGGTRSLQSFRNSLKNSRDRFDAHVESSGRVGWRKPDEARSPAVLPRLSQELLNRWALRDDDELLAAVLAVRGDVRVIPAAMPVEGEVRYTRTGRTADSARVLARQTEADRRRPEFARRRSRDAKLIGDRGEEVVLSYLRSQPDIAAATIVHRAALGETPGWDVDCQTTSGELLRIEVKATMGPRMTTFEISENERAAAEMHGPEYAVFAVTSVFSAAPRVHRINNLWSLLTEGTLEARPVQWLVGGFEAKSGEDRSQPA